MSAQTAFRVSALMQMPKTQAIEVTSKTDMRKTTANTQKPRCINPYKDNAVQLTGEPLRLRGVSPSNTNCTNGEETRFVQFMQLTGAMA